MIDQDVFSRRMDRIARRFGREIDADVTGDYFEFLAPRMTTEQFERAAERVFAHDKFWPEPARFLEAAGLGPQAKAEEAWETVIADANARDQRPLGEYDEATRAALRAIEKTPHKLGYDTESSEIEWLRKRFVKAYRRHVVGEEDQPPGLTAGDNSDLPEIEGLG